MIFFSLVQPKTLENDYDYSSLEPILARFKELFRRNGLKLNCAGVEGPEVEILFSRCILDWLDDLFESLDSISDYPPPSTYMKSEVFPMTQPVLEGLVKHLRKLCILRYKTVPKIVSEEDFWCWVYFGIERNRLEILEDKPEETNRVLDGYIRAHLQERQLSSHRKQIVEERLKLEQLNDKIAGEDHSAVLAFATAPEKTFPLIQKRMSSLVKSITLANHEDDPPQRAVESQDVEIEFVDGQLR